MKKGGNPMNRTIRVATMTIALAAFASIPAFASHQPLPEWKQSPRDEREPGLTRVLRNIRRVLIHILDTPTMPPPH
jgi:hypothetical protein